MVAFPDPSKMTECPDSMLRFGGVTSWTVKVAGPADALSFPASSFTLK